MRILATAVLAVTLFTPDLHAQDYNDNTIVSRVNRALQNSDELKGSDITVISVNGYVLLAGQALSDRQKQQASVAAAFASDDIRRLINELEVVDALDTSFNNSDAALLARAFEATKDVSPETVIVIHNGVVHLMGQVTREKGNEVATIISKLPGVKNIRLSYEFI